METEANRHNLPPATLVFATQPARQITIYHEDLKTLSLFNQDTGRKTSRRLQRTQTEAYQIIMICSIRLKA